MQAAKQVLPHYTYEDYQHWEGQWELINGIPFAMSPSPVPRHQGIAAALTSEFYVQLKNCNQCKVYPQLDYKISEDTVLHPDIQIVCVDIEDKKYVDIAPLLIVEVLSPSTALKDRHTKFPIYEAQGVKYFIIISPTKEEVEIYELKDGEYDLKLKGREIKYDFIFEDCKASIDFKEIWK